MAAACVSLPTDASWGDISLVGSPAQIVFAFGDKIVQVDPNSGQPVRLRDANGDIRLDDTGKAREWSVLFNPGSAPLHFYTRPVQTGDTTLIAAAYEDKLLEIDINRAEVSNGNLATLPGKVVGNPLLTETSLYVPLSDGGLLALDPNEFTEQWRISTEKNKGIWSQPLLVDNTLYVASMDHFLYSIDSATGEQNWSLDLEGALASTPVFANDALYLGSLSNRLFKVSTDGELIAQFTTQGWMWGSPAVIDDMVYAGDSNGNVYALRDSGTSLDQVWSQKIANGTIRMTPLVLDDTIVVGSRDHFVYWVDRETGTIRTDGQAQIKRDMGGEILSNMVLVNEDQAEPLIIVSSIDHGNLLKAYTLQGLEKWKYPL
jgi:outer membrane protein assembly factor BamB